MNESSESESEVDTASGSESESEDHGEGDVGEQRAHDRWQNLDYRVYVR